MPVNLYINGVKITGDNYPPPLRPYIAAVNCEICGKPFGEHSDKDFVSCMNLITEPEIDFPCEICGKLFKEHSHEESLSCTKLGWERRTDTH